MSSPDLDTPVDQDATPLDQKVRRIVEKRCKVIVEKYENILGKMRAEKEAAPILVRQLLVCSSMKNKKPNKFSPEMKDFCAKLYKISPKAYTHCHKHLPLPGRKTVSQFILLEKLSQPIGWLPPKKIRINFTPEQIFIMRAAFAANTHPNRNEWKILSEKCGCDWKRIRKWFEKQREVQKHATQKKLQGLSVDQFEVESEDEESVDELKPNESRRLPRVIMTPTQIAKLEAFYAKNDYLDRADYERVVRDVSCDLKKIKKWFENRRHKIRRAGCSG